MSKKTAISIRLESKTLLWFKNNYKSGYQSAMRNILENHIDKIEAHKCRVYGQAEELFRQYHTQCFWHYPPELHIDEKTISLVISGLRKYGGRVGYQRAYELEKDLLCH